MYWDITQKNVHPRAEKYTQLAKMTFDEILDLTADGIDFFINIFQGCISPKKIPGIHYEMVV